MPSFVALQGKIQNYQWGGYEFIYRLLSTEPKPNEPAAEYWLGAHASAPSTLPLNGSQSLPEFIRQNSLADLAFLFKVLDVRDMLSIQVHPCTAQAQDGFARENAAGIALNAKHRNYKDASDKPELMVALSEFWLLHGFQSFEATRTALQQKPFLGPLVTCLEKEGLAAAFKLALDNQHPSVNQMQTDLADFITQGKAPTERHNIDFWVHRWLQANPQTLSGLLTLYFFNLVKLNPGDAIYQPPGLPHAYLEGQNIELMANSDNVLRAGLTPKHIDVPELMGICKFQHTAPFDFIIQPELGTDQQKQFVTPFDAFELSELDGRRSTGYSWRAETPEILFCYSGNARLSDGAGVEQPMNRGASVFIVPGSTLTLDGLSPEACFYRAKNRLVK